MSWKIERTIDGMTIKSPVESGTVLLEQEESPGTKYDFGKPMVELLPPSYWREVGSNNSYEMARWYFYAADFPQTLGYNAVPVLEYGALCKYGSHNWHQGMKWGRLVGSFHRHCNFLDESGVWLSRDLNELDEETKLPHGQHAECCRIFLQEYWEAWQNNIFIGENDCSWNYKKEK